MSDLTLTILIVAPSVIAGLLALLYFTKQAEKVDVAKLLPHLKCPCGCSSLLWNGKSWGIDLNLGSEFDSMTDRDPSSQSVESESGFIFKCPQCHQELWFDHAGKLYQHTAIK